MMKYLEYLAAGFCGACGVIVAILIIWWVAKLLG